LGASADLISLRAGAKAYSRKRGERRMDHRRVVQARVKGKGLNSRERK